MGGSHSLKLSGISNCSRKSSKTVFYIDISVVGVYALAQFANWIKFGQSASPLMDKENGEEEDEFDDGGSE